MIPEAAVEAAIELQAETQEHIRQQVIPEAAVEAACSWRVGPVWKLGGEVCTCKLGANHPMPHECTCGAWFEGCGAK